MPFPLPAEGTAYTEDLDYFLVAVPSRVEYRRAALGAYTEFTKAWLWGLEKQHPIDSPDAAASWELAVSETLRLLEMNWPDLVIDHIDELETLLRQIAQNDIGVPPCCGNLDPEDEIYPITIDPGVGAAPEEWGDTPVANWDEYYLLLCGAAHNYATLLAENARKLDVLVQAGVAAITLVAAILGVLTGAGLLLKVSYGVAAALVGSLVSVAKTTILEQSADDIDARYKEIVCAIVHGTPHLSEVVRDIVGETAWLAFYQWVDYNTALAVMYSGSAGDKVLPPWSLDECSDCPEPQVYSWDFLSDAQSWILNNNPSSTIWTNLEGQPPGAIQTGFASGQVLRSPNFTIPASSAFRVRFQKRRRSSGGGRNSSVAVRRASDDVLMYSTSYTDSTTTAWVDRLFPYGALGANEYYVTIRWDQATAVDNVSVEFDEIV